MEKQSGLEQFLSKIHLFLSKNTQNNVR